MSLVPGVFEHAICLRTPPAALIDLVYQLQNLNEAHNNERRLLSDGPQVTRYVVVSGPPFVASPRLTIVHILAAVLSQNTDATIINTFRYTTPISLYCSTGVGL